MNHKKSKFRFLSVILLSVICVHPCLSVVNSQAQAPAQNDPPPDRYNPGEVSLTLHGTIATEDLERTRGGVGADLTWYAHDNWGVALETNTRNLKHNFIDEVGVNLRYRIANLGRNKASALYGLAGGGYDLERERFLIQVGGGVQHRFTKHIGLDMNVRMSKTVDGGVEALLRFGPTLAF